MAVWGNEVEGSIEIPNATIIEVTKRITQEKLF